MFSNVRVTRLSSRVLWSWKVGSKAWRY